jgi:hypothetical protein
MLAIFVWEITYFLALPTQGNDIVFRFIIEL